MIRRSGWFAVTVLAFTAASSPLVAQADPNQDQQYLQMVHSNGVGGQDGTLLRYAQAYCSGGMVDWGLVGELMGQIGVFNKAGVYVVQTAASRIYCPNKIVQPPPPPVYIDRY